MKSHWSTYLNKDEMYAYQEILQWEKAPGRSFENYCSFATPVNDYLQKLSPEMMNQVSIIVRSVLKSLRDYSHYTVYPSSILEKISLKAGSTLISLDQVKEISISYLDKAALECISFNRGVAAAEGGFTGMMGFQGLMIDIPFLYGVLFRIIEEISLCYGYRIDTPEERFHILTTLETSHMTEEKDRSDAFLKLANLQLSLRGGISLSHIQQNLSKGLMSLSQRLGSALLGRRLALILKIAGGVTGGIFNYLLAQQIADSAFHIYRKRFLTDRAEKRRADLPAPEAENGTDR